MKKLLLLLIICLSVSFSNGFSHLEKEQNQEVNFLNFSPLATIPKIEKIPYERFIGLGCCCLTRFQINRHLSARFGLDANSFGGGQLFDWLAIHDYNKLAEAIENNLSDLFEKSDLILGPSWDPVYLFVKNIKYQMTWNHLFSRQASWIDPNIIELEYETKKCKIDYLSEKFRDLKHYRTLYIVAYPFTTPEIIGAIEPDKKVMDRLCQALKKLRGNSNFTILFCPLQQKFGEFANIRIYRLSPPKEGPCVGDFDCWNNILSQFPFTLDKIEVDSSLLDNSFNS